MFDENLMFYGSICRWNLQWTISNEHCFSAIFIFHAVKNLYEVVGLSPFATLEKVIH